MWGIGSLFQRGTLCATRHCLAGDSKPGKRCGWKTMYQDGLISTFTEYFVELSTKLYYAEECGIFFWTLILFKNKNITIIRPVSGEIILISNLYLLMNNIVKYFHKTRHTPFGIPAITVRLFKFSSSRVLVFLWKSGSIARFITTAFHPWHLSQGGISLSLLAPFAVRPLQPSFTSTLRLYANVLLDHRRIFLKVLVSKQIYWLKEQTSCSQRHAHVHEKETSFATFLAPKSKKGPRNYWPRFRYDDSGIQTRVVAPSKGQPRWLTNDISWV